MIVAWLVALSTAAVALGADVAVEFSMEDQYGVQRSSGQLRGRSYVLVIADRDGAEHSVRWGEYLYRALGDDVAIIGCANLDGVPWFLRWLVRGKFRERVTAIPILLDWNGELFRAYSCTEKVPTLVAVNKSGEVALRFSGVPDAESLRSVALQLRQRLGLDRQ